MVPLADIFNHKASVVELGEGYEVHGADGSSDDDGEEEEEDGEEEEEDEEDGGEEVDDVKSGGSGGEGEGEEASDSGNGSDGGSAEAAEHGPRHKRHRHAPGGGCCGGSELSHEHGEHEHGKGDGHEQAPPLGVESAAQAGSNGGALPAVMSGAVAGIFGIESGAHAAVGGLSREGACGGCGALEHTGRCVGGHGATACLGGGAPFCPHGPIRCYIWRPTLVHPPNKGCRCCPLDHRPMPACLPRHPLSPVPRARPPSAPLAAANGLHLRLQMGIVDRDEDTLEIVAASAIPAGAEVHNT